MASHQAPPVSKHGFDLGADQTGRIRASMIVLIIIPTIAVILRLVSRKISRAGYWWDDLLIIVALLLSYAMPVINLQGIPKGLGRHIWILPKDATPTFFKDLYVFQIFFVLSTCCNKLSILAFYRRIFPIAQLRVVLLFMTGIVICFTTSFLMVVILQCLPIHALWDLHERFHARCLPTDRLMIVPGGINCVIDAIIVFMPIPLLWRLRTTKGQKATLTAVFMVAGFVVLVSIIRLVVLSRVVEIDLTWNFINAAIWTVVEPSMGVVSACLPSLRPLFKRIVSGTYKGPSLHTSRKTSVQNCESRSSSRLVWIRAKGFEDERGNMRSFRQLEENSCPAPWGHTIQVHGGRIKGEMSRPDSSSLEESRSGDGRIRVKTEVTLISTERMEYKDQLF